MRFLLHLVSRTSLLSTFIFWGIWNYWLYDWELTGMLTWRVLRMIKIPFLNKFFYCFKVLIFYKSFMSKLSKHTVFAHSPVYPTRRYLIINMFSTLIDTMKRVIRQNWNSWRSFLHHWFHFGLCNDFKFISTKNLYDLVDCLQFWLKENLLLVVNDFLSVNWNHWIWFKSKYSQRIRSWHTWKLFYCQHVHNAAFTHFTSEQKLIFYCCKTKFFLKLCLKIGKQSDVFSLGKYLACYQLYFHELFNTIVHFFKIFTLFKSWLKSREKLQTLKLYITTNQCRKLHKFWKYIFRIASRKLLTYFWSWNVFNKKYVFIILKVNNYCVKNSFMMIGFNMGLIFSWLELIFCQYFSENRLYFDDLLIMFGKNRIHLLCKDRFYNIEFIKFFWGDNDFGQ